MKFRILDICLYFILVAAVTGGLFYARSTALEVYGGTQAQAEWDAFKKATQEMNTASGPVIRRVPKSAEPLALKLMRDYFGVCLALSLLLSSVLFITLLIFVRGALATPAFVDRSPPEPKKAPPTE